MDALFTVLNQLTSSQCFFGIPFIPLYGKMFGLNIVVIYDALAIITVFWAYAKFRQGLRYSKYLLMRFGYVLLGGRFNAGKTRLLTQFAESVRHITFTCCNYFYENNFCSWTSKADLGRLMDDLLRLGELQSFTIEERKQIRKQFPGFWSEKDIKAFKAKYKHIPVDCGLHCEFFLGGDEFHQYFINRDAMMNFTGDMGKRFNQTLHQVRHFHVLAALATQEIDILDLKFRQLADYEIDTVEYLGGILYGYNFFSYVPNKRQTKEEKDERQFRKVNFFPILFINWYLVNKIMRRWEISLTKWVKIARLPLLARWIESKSAKWQKPSWLTGKYEYSVDWAYRAMKGDVVLPTFSRLPFNTKFNVNIFVDSYQEGDIFRKLNEFFKTCETPENYLRVNS